MPGLRRRLNQLSLRLKLGPSSSRSPSVSPDERSCSPSSAPAHLFPTVPETTLEVQRPATNNSLNVDEVLTCAICGEILYQPVTVLICLHTFCGSCLKQWFGSQNDSPCRSSFTCPSCRGTADAIKPNATITTLLDRFLEVNPGKVKSVAEKAEIARMYDPALGVIPEFIVSTTSWSPEQAEAAIGQGQIWDEELYWQRELIWHT